MILLLAWVVVLAGLSESHYVVLPLEGYGQLQPTYHYVVSHSLPAPPSIPTRPWAGGRDVSRETLEDQDDSFQQHIPDISEEQEALGPDDEQIVQKPVLPHVPLPRPPARPLLPPSKGRPQQPPAGPRPQPGPAPDVKTNGPNEDGSYDFSYSLPDQSRSEKGDSSGNVEGSYSYTGPDGNKVEITYRAGAGTGYVAVGEGLLPPPPPSQGGDDDQQSLEPEGDDGQQHQDGDDGQQHQDGDDDQQSLLPAGDDGQQHIDPRSDDGTSGGHGGMPYSYNYNTDLSSKSETADDQGNVEGTYTYVDGAGIQRTVSYTVRGDEGFIATGDIHPDPGTPEGTSSAPAPRPQARPQPPPRPAQNPSVPPVKRPSVPPVQRPQPLPPSDDESGGGHGGMPYSYNYNTELSSKSETADGQGNVEGSYTYIDGAGIERRVMYTVRGDEGFIATGDLHPDPGSDAPAVPGPSKSAPRPSAPGAKIPGIPAPRPAGPSAPGAKIPGIPWPAVPSHPLPRPGPGVKGVQPVIPDRGVKGGSGWAKYPLGR